MAVKKYIPKVDKKLLTVKLSYNETSNRFFIDFWDINEMDQSGNYIVSICISKAEAEGISRDTGIKILS